MDPLLPSYGFSHILTSIDCFSHWPEAIPISDIIAETVARVFIKSWISSFSVHSIVIAGRGCQFESATYVEPAHAVTWTSELLPTTLLSMDSLNVSTVS